MNDVDFIYSFGRRLVFILAWLVLNQVQMVSQTLNVSLLSTWSDQDLIVSDGLRYNDIWGYASEDGREYAILGSVEFTHFVDITDPANPIEVDREEGRSNCIWRDFKTYGHYAYAVSDYCSGSLQIFDLSTLPDSVTLVYDSDEFFDDAHNIFIDTSRSRLYASGIHGSQVDLVALDLKEDLINNTGPDRPALIKEVSLVPGYVHDLYVRNDTAYCSHGNSSSLYIYDFTDLDQIEVLGALTSYTGQGYNHSSWVSDDAGLLILADENHDSPVKLIDIEDPDNIELVSSFQSTLLAPQFTNSIPHNPFILNGKYAVVSYYHDGIQIYRIDDHENPFRAAYMDTNTEHTGYGGYKGCWGVYPFMPSGRIIGSDISNGLFIISTQFPTKECEDEAHIEGTYDNHWDMSVKSSLTSNAEYMSGTVLKYSAGLSVELEPGFLLGDQSSMDLIISSGCDE